LIIRDAGRRSSIRITDKDRRKIADGLARMQADTCTLYLKTLHFHWNVTGTLLQTLHLMFETQYNNIWLAVGMIAQRMCALGFPAPESSAEFAVLTNIKESNGVQNAWMLRSLLEA
jgi:starvation-inducible DNA-binding protein